MNQQKKIAYQIIAALFLVLQIFTNGYASDATFEVDLTAGAKSVRIKGEFTENSRVTNRKNLAFLNSISSSNELGKRVSDVRLFDGAVSVDVNGLPMAKCCRDGLSSVGIYDRSTPPKNNAARRMFGIGSHEAS